jgi:hypothetical protein
MIAETASIPGLKFEPVSTGEYVRTGKTGEEDRIDIGAGNAPNSRIVCCMILYIYACVT